jgi:hypothetical protein
VLCAACDVDADIHEANLVDDPGTHAPPRRPTGSLEGTDVGGAAVEVHRASAREHAKVHEHAEVERSWPHEKEYRDVYRERYETCWRRRYL